MTFKCKTCSDTGYVIEKSIPEYGGQPIEFAVPCPKCKGKRREGEETGIPENYFGASLCHFDFSLYQADMKKIKEIVTSFFNEYQTRWENNGKGLYIWSNEAGSGKTLLACSLAHSIMIKYDLQMRFISHGDYIAQILEDIERRKRNEEPKAGVYKECDLLVLDDLGTAKNGAYQAQCLFELLDYRMRNCKITIFTANDHFYNLNLDKRVGSRIDSMTFPIHFPEESIRKKISEQKNKKFIEKILKSPK